MATQESLSNQTCQLCREHPASHFCNCQDPLTTFCTDCLPRHHAKYLRAVHQICPIAALHCNPPEYTSKVEVLEKKVAEVRKNLERMEQFSKEFEDLIQTCINYLSEYRRCWQEFLQKERAELSATIEAAIQEATRCLDEGIEPESGLGRALWTLPAEELQVFSYSVTPPDVKTLCQTWASYQNTLQSLCERFSTKPASPPEEEKQSTAMDTPQVSLDFGVPSLFAAVWSNKVELYDLESQQSTKHTLSVDFHGGGSYVQVDRHTLICIGGWPASTEVYGLDLISLQLTSLPPLRIPRFAAGVAKTANTVYVFGGKADVEKELKSCEKYGLQDRQSLPLNDMRVHRRYFTPCTFRNLIYLPCPLTILIIETFSPDTETFTDLPVSLPLQMIDLHSVSFVANGDLFILTPHKQMGRWRIESEREFCLFDTNRDCWSTQPPLVIDSLVLIANNSYYYPRVEEFNLESYDFLRNKCAIF